MCQHLNQIGDNNGISCMDCKEQLQGFGCNGGYPASCIHDWYSTIHMKYEICTWCESIRPNLNYQTIEEAEAAAEGAFAD